MTKPTLYAFLHAAWIIALCGLVSCEKAVLDEDNNRYILSPIPETGITIGDALRAIKSSTKTSWRKIATFCGLQNQTIAFKVAYVARKFEEKTTLSNFLVISGDKAYLYDKDHRPASSTLLTSKLLLVSLLIR